MHTVRNHCANMYWHNEHYSIALRQPSITSNELARHARDRSAQDAANSGMEVVKWQGEMVDHNNQKKIEFVPVYSYHARRLPRSAIKNLTNGTPEPPVPEIETYKPTTV